MTTNLINDKKYIGKCESVKFLSNRYLGSGKNIQKAIEAQSNRYKRSDKYNGNATSKDIDKIFKLSDDSKSFLLQAAKKIDLSARSYFKIIKVARTIADLESAANIEIPHLAEALQYRQITAS